MLLISLTLLFFTGFLIVAGFLPDSKPGERLSLSFPFGMGVTTLAIWAMLIIKVPLSKTSLLFLQALLFLMFFHFARRKQISALSNGWSATTKTRLDFFLLLIPLLAGSGLVFNLFFPVLASDGVGYKIHGEMTVLEQNLMAYRDLIRIFDDGKRTLGFPLISGYFILFGIKNPGLVQSFYYISLLSFFYIGMIKFTEARTAAWMTLLLASSPMVWWHSFLYLNNLSTGFYFSCGYFYWFLFVHHKDPRFLRISSLGFMLAAWMRYETIVFFMVTLAYTYFLSIKHRIAKAPVNIVLLPLLFSGCWVAYIATYNPASEIGNVTGVNMTLSYLIIFVFLLSSWIATQTAIATNQDVKSVLRGVMIVALAGAASVLFTEFGQKRVVQLIPVMFELFFDNTLNKFAWGFAILLVLAIPFLYRSLSLPQKYLLGNLALTFILSIVLIVVVYIKEPSLKNAPFSEWVSLFLKDLSSKVDRPSNRSFFTIFPALLFFLGLSFQTQSNPHEPRRPFIKFLLNDDRVLNGMKLLVFGNLLAIITLFLVPRLMFIKDHFGESYSQIQQSKGSKDNPNIYFATYKIAYAIASLTPENSTIILPSPENLIEEAEPYHNIGVFQSYDVLYPRRILWGIPRKTAPSSGKTYLVTNGRWLNNRCTEHPEGKSLGYKNWTICPVPGKSPQDQG